MNSQVCIICFNKKVINQTNNRLVTESCGHVKCMNCLLHENSGCLACLRNGSESDKLTLKERENEQIKTYELPNESEIMCENNDVYLEDLSLKKKSENSHIKVEMEDGKKCYKCTICNKKFYAKSQVSYHSYCNGQKKPYQCQPCKQSFASLSHYKYHMKIHSQERSYSCDVCGASFYQMSKLKRHKLKHTKEKIHKCNDCDKAFNNLSALRKHALMHTEERPYTCPICSRRFRDGSNYKKHVDKHKKICAKCNEQLPEEGVHICGAGSGGPRAHACPRCRKAFHSRKDMRRHAAIHTDSKPFRCKVCPEERRFRRKDNLERHIRNAHPDCNPSAALECDINALQSITHTTLSDPDHGYEQTEKIRLKILNPLPPLPQEVIQKHIDVTEAPKEVNVTNVVDKKSIIEANNARQSVIVEKKIAEGEKKVPSPENEYVHKIRKAIIPLPPIDQEKFKSVQRGILPDSETAPIKNMEIYKKILFDSTQIQNPKTHWMRKMEQDIK